MDCKVCGSDETKVQLKSIKINRFGLTNVTLQNVEHITCEDCGNTTQSLPKYNLIMKQLQISLASCNRPLTGKEFAFLRDKLGLTGKQVAEKLGVTNVSVSRWEKEHKTLSPMADRLIRAFTLEKINSVSISEVVERISENGDPEIYLDVDDFKDVATFRHTSGYRFNKSYPAWVVNNIR